MLLDLNQSSGSASEFEQGYPLRIPAVSEAGPSQSAYYPPNQAPNYVAHCAGAERVLLGSISNFASGRFEVQPMIS